ncbi:MAG: DUF5677 domain-containing protein [Actinomycetota bacterium]|nr:DUF5677 domain-containing protein [Actinomycetota bacterium]
MNSEQSSGPSDALFDLRERLVVCDQLPTKAHVDFLRETSRTLYSIIEGVEVRGMTAYPAVILGICVHFFNSFVAVVDLLGLGQSKSALALHRSLFELMLHARWIKEDPDPRSRRYIDYATTLYPWFASELHQKWGKGGDLSARREELAEKLVDLSERYGVIQGNPEQVAEKRIACLANPQRCAEHLRDAAFRGSPTGTWHGLSVRRLARDIGVDFPAGGGFERGADYIEFLYDVFYELTSQQVHGAPQAVGDALEATESGVTIEMGPDPAETEKVVSTSFAFARWTFDVLGSATDKDFESEFDPLHVKYGELLPAE